ncbi:MAG TPA: pitrilysin family protein [Bryobacteraceae bacterium]|nr:pitrilysin family protein [Bryobacteraceae bacterium]
MRLFRSLLIALLAAGAASTQTLPAGVQKITSVEGITEYAYPNGLRVLLFPDDSKPKVTVNITYLVGSRHEGNGETGMAHLMEHMLFIRSKSDRDIKKELTDHGASWNGSTWYDRTNYFETVTATDENLRWAVGLEAERMVNMRIEKELLDKEMTVVRNEFEMGENQPINVLYQRTLESSYIFHSYGKPAIGSRSDIEHVPIQRLDAFYHKFYQPDNAVLTIAGKFDETKALALVADSFKAVPKPQRVLEQTYTIEPTQDGERQVTLRRIGDNQALLAVYHTPAASHPDTAALEVLAVILGDTPSGRLYKALVESKKAVNVAADEQELHDPGFFLARILLREDQSLDDARETMLKTIASVVSEPPSKEEVDRAKNRILKQIDLELTNSESIGLVMSEFASAGDWRLLFLLRDRIKAVTPADVARVAKAYIKDSNRTLGAFIPSKAPDRAEIPAGPDLAAVLKDYKGGAEMAKGENFSPTPSNIEGRVIRARLPGGARLVMLPKKTRGGEVMATVRLDFADEQSILGRTVAANVTGSLLIRGTKNKTRQQIQDEFDRLKARAGVSGNAISATANLETTEENLAGALRLAAEILREPAFPEREFDQFIQQQIAGIEATRKDPQFLASNELNRHLSPYPRGHFRYVSTPDERLEDLKKVTLDQVRQFHRDFYGASNATIAISGQFDPEQMRKLVAELFDGWKSPSKYVRLPLPYRKVEPASQKIETADKEMALFTAGTTEKISDNDPDYPAMLLANFMLGGSGASHLFKRVRDKEGLSYGVFSNFSAPEIDDGGRFVVTAISAPQNTPKVEASIKDELARVVKDGFSSAEVADAKTSWLQERMVGRTEERSLVATLTQRERFDRTLKWDDELEAKVAALTPDQVSQAFRRHIDPSALTVVRGGDFKKAGVYQ